MGIDVRKSRFVPYKSAGDAIVAMLAGEIDMVCGTAANMPPFMASGRVRALAVISPQRLQGALAATPTMQEAGFNASFTNWRGVVGAKGMAASHVAFWEQALAERIEPYRAGYPPEVRRAIERRLAAEMGRAHV